MLLPIALTLLIILLGIAAYFYVQNHAFLSLIWKEVGELAEGSAVDPETIRDRPSLPAPMQRYLDYAIGAGRENVGFMRLRHGGTLTLKPGEEALTIEGEEYFHCSEPGFIWTGKAKMNPFVWVRARDTYARGHGNMLIKLRAAVTLADSSGPEMDSSSLLRYLAEMPWFPTSFLTVQGLEFEEIDNNTVCVQLTDKHVSVSGTFRINDDGSIAGFYSKDRFREENGRMVQTPWKGDYSDYREVDGLRIPHQAVIAWELPEGDFPYALFAITHAEYDIPAPY